MYENAGFSIGVIIPVFIRELEGERQLYRALGSIIQQSFTPMEVILTVDNPEPNNYLFTKLVREFSDLNIKIVKNYGPRGVSSNSNNGIKLMQSKYTHILHQDDWLIDSNVYIEIAEYSTASTECFFLLPGKILDSVFFPKFDLTALLGNNRFGGPSGMIYPSDSSILYDERLSMLCDVDFIIQLRKKFGEPKVFDRALLEYGVSAGQVQRNITKEQFSQELQTIFAKHKPNRWKIILITLFRYKSDELHGIAHNLGQIDNSIFLALFIKIVILYSRLFSRLKRKISQNHCESLVQRIIIER